MSQVNIRVDDNGLAKKFGLLQKQTDYAMSNAINNTLKKAQAAQVKYMQRKYTIRRSGLLRATVRLLQYSKRTTLTGVVGINPKLDFWNIHEKGGMKRSKKSKYVAVPLEVKRSKRGTIPKSKRPRNLDRSFVIPTRGGKVVFQRKGRGKRSSVSPMYSLNLQVRIRPNLNFERNVTNAINGLWESEMNKAVQFELKRARLR